MSIYAVILLCTVVFLLNRVAKIQLEQDGMKDSLATEMIRLDSLSGSNTWYSNSTSTYTDGTRISIPSKQRRSCSIKWSYDNEEGVIVGAITCNDNKIEKYKKVPY